MSKNSLRLSARNLSVFKDQYDGVAAERALQKVVPKPLDAKTTSELVELLKNPPAGEEKFLVDLLLTLDKKTKKNVFSGRVLEIEGLPNLRCEQAFELSDASAERSAGGCTIKLNKEPIIEYMTSNIAMLKWMIAEGYGDVRCISRRIAKMEAWIANPVLLEADKDAVYHGRH